MKIVILLLLGIGIGMACPAAASWQTPVNLGSTINSTADDWYPVVARDGSFMIFASNRAGGFGDSDLWISRRIDGQWQTPQNLGSAVNTSSVESAPYLASGDSTLYFVSGSTGNGDIYTCPLVNDVPGARTKLPYPINTTYSLDCCPVLSRDGSQMYICSDRSGTYGGDDVWVSQRIGTSWSTPVNLGATVNTTADDCPRWLSDDGKTLLILSTRTDGLGGADNWVTQNDGTGWSAPTNLGAPLNSTADDVGAWFVGGGGSMHGTIYFGSGRDGRFGGWDIWTADEEPPTAVPEPPPGQAGDRLGLGVRPNPASSGTILSYDLPEAARVTIDIHDVRGRRIRRLLDAEQAPGSHTVRWDAYDDRGARASSGVCYCRLQAGTRQACRRIVLLR